MQRMERYLATTDEAADNKLYISSESEDTTTIKTELIQKAVE